MLITGNQLKAARALIGMEQGALADAAGVHVNTIRKMEAKATEELTSGAVIVRKVQMALETAGVEFLNHGRPGVRLRDRDKD
jgi:DNA-binding XRE family transcriptional regulator